MLNLPVCQLAVTLRPPTGREELCLLEATGGETETAIQLLDALCDLPQGAAELPLPDLEFLLLQLRRTVLGDRVQCDLRCPECSGRVDFEFSLRDYLAHESPAPAAETEGQTGWFAVPGARFRLATAADVVAASGKPEALAQRCIQAQDGRAKRRAEAAMARLAPALSRMLDGGCPHCGKSIPVFFDVQSFVLNELRGHAAFLYLDIHRLATAYHWSEAEILRLPQRRRAQYAAMAGGDRA